MCCEICICINYRHVAFEASCVASFYDAMEPLVKSVEDKNQN